MVGERVAGGLQKLALSIAPTPLLPPSAPVVPTKSPSADGAFCGRGKYAEARCRQRQVLLLSVAASSACVTSGNHIGGGLDLISPARIGALVSTLVSKVLPALLHDL